MQSDPQITQTIDPQAEPHSQQGASADPDSRPADYERSSTSQSAILAGIVEVARKHLDWSGPVSVDMPLLETFNLDSLRQLTLVVELEDRFRIRLDERDEESIVTVGDLVAAIRRKLAGRGSDAR